MKLQIEQSEIEIAVHQYIAAQGIKVEGKELEVKFAMTRGEAGLIADINITEPKPVETTKRGANIGKVGAVLRDTAKQAPAVDPAKAAIDQALAKAAAAKEAKQTELMEEAAAEDQAEASTSGGEVAGSATEAEVAGAADQAQEAAAPAAEEPAAEASTKAKSLFG